MSALNVLMYTSTCVMNKCDQQYITVSASLQCQILVLFVAQGLHEHNILQHLDIYNRQLLLRYSASWQGYKL